MPGKINIFICLIWAVFFASQAMQAEATHFADIWIHATVLIENEWGGKGSGFFVKHNERIFLCTAKHVLNAKKDLRDGAAEIKLYLNIRKKDKVAGRAYILSLLREDGAKNWKEHPDDNVDVLVFDVTDFIALHPEVDMKAVDYSLFADEKTLHDEHITIGEEVVIIGYPAAFRQGETNLPVARQGMVATQIGQRYTEESLDEEGTKRSRTLRGFLIDGGIIPGSSGSPVITKPAPAHSKANGRHPHYLLGMAAEFRFTAVKVGKDHVPSYAGMGFAFDASTLKETIELFFK